MCLCMLVFGGTGLRTGPLRGALAPMRSVSVRSMPCLHQDVAALAVSSGRVSKLDPHVRLFARPHSMCRRQRGRRRSTGAQSGTVHEGGPSWRVCIARLWECVGRDLALDINVEHVILAVGGWNVSKAGIVVESYDVGIVDGVKHDDAAPNPL